MPLYVPGGSGAGNGTPGAPGASAYDIWLSLGNVGTQAQYIASLVGPKGDPGAVSTTPGPQGPAPVGAVRAIRQNTDGTYPDISAIAQDQELMFIGPTDPGTTLFAAHPKATWLRTPQS